MSMRQFNLPPKLRSPNRESSGTIAASKCVVARVAALIAALLFLCVPAHAQGIVYEVFGAYLDSLRDQAGIPGLAAAIVDTKGIVWERAYGRQDVGRALATRTDTPFNADGLTQTITAAMVLRCAEERRLSLDDTVGSFGVAYARARRVDSPASDPHIRRRRKISHFSFAPSGLRRSGRSFASCAVDSYRETFANLLHRLAMFDSVPGPNIVSIAPPAEGVPDPDDVERYAAILQRRATPYRGGRSRACGAVFVSGVHIAADAVDGARDDGARSGEIRSRVEAGNSARAAARSSTRGARRA